MILDKNLQFSAEQAITADAMSTNVVDTGKAGLNVGVGEPMAVAVSVDAAFNTLTSLDFELQESAAENMGTPTTLAVTNKLLAALTAKARFVIPVPPTVSKRYLGLNYNVQGTNPTTGKVTAHLIPLSAADQWTGYASGYAVS